MIPGFVPVIGLADNVMVTAWALRSAIRKSGPDVVSSNWPGSQAGFTLLCRLCQLKIPDGTGTGKRRPGNGRNVRRRRPRH